MVLPLEASQGFSARCPSLHVATLQGDIPMDGADMVDLSRLDLCCSALASISSLVMQANQSILGWIIPHVCQAGKLQLKRRSRNAVGGVSTRRPSLEIDTIVSNAEAGLVSNSEALSYLKRLVL